MTERDAERKRYAVQAWTGRFGQMVRSSRDSLGAVQQCDDKTIEAVLDIWLRALTDSFNYLTVDLAAPTSNRYHLRTSLIHFTTTSGVTGKHWITYDGGGKPHDTGLAFGSDSVAYRVAIRELASPTRVDTDARGSDGEPRGETSYRAYSVARISETLVLSIDWQVDAISDEYLDILDAAVEGFLVGNITDILKSHSRF
jgi:hypothetical protein